MGGGGKGGNAGKSYDYYGSMAGAICSGPVDELLSIIVDGKMEWPTAVVWQKSASYQPGTVVSYGGRAYEWDPPISAPSAGVEPPGGSWKIYSVKRIDNGVEASNPYHLTVAKYGEVDFYWGKKDQQLLPELNKPKHPRNTFINQGHPPYRNQCFALFWNFLWGRERQGAPNIEIVVRRLPDCPILGPMALDGDGQANPLAAEVELLTHPIWGAGLPATRFDAAKLLIEANNLKPVAPATISNFYISTTLNDQEPLRSVLSESLSYRDGFWRFDESGLFQPGLFPRNQAGPLFNAANTIDNDALVDQIALTENDWAQTGSEAVVRFNNAVLAYHDDMVKATSGYAKVIVGEVRQKVVSRPWVLRGAQAAMYAQEYLKTISQPYFSGSLQIRKHRCPSVTPGTLFLLVHSLLGIKIICRCLGRTVASPKDGTVTIKFESDRGLAPLPFSTAVTREQGKVLGAVELITAFHVLQPPPSFYGGQGNYITVLAARHDMLTTELAIWLRANDSTAYYQLGAHRQFAVRGTLKQAYPANLPPANVSPPDDDTGSLVVTLDPDTIEPDKLKIEETQTKDSINDNNLLVWVVPKTNPTDFEIMTVKSLALVGDSYQVKVRRNRFGTGPKAFAAGDYAYIVHKQDVPLYTHDAFQTFMLTQYPAQFRLVTSNPAAAGDETTDSGQYTEAEYRFADPYSPTAIWAWITANGVAITDFTQPHLASETFAYHVDAHDPTGDLVQTTIVARLASTQTNLLDRPSSPSTGQAIDGSFRPSDFNMGEGDWALEAVVRDASGRVVRQQLTATPGGPSVYLRLRTSTAPGYKSTIQPVAEPPPGAYRDRNDFLIELRTTSTADLPVIEFQRVPMNVTVPGATWTTYTDLIQFTVPVGFSNGQRIFARTRTGTGGSLAYSPTGTFDYWAEI